MVQSNLKKLRNSSNGSQISIQNLNRTSQTQNLHVSVNAWRSVQTDSAVAKIQGNIYEAAATITLLHENKDQSITTRTQSLRFYCVELTNDLSADRFAL
jgi:hypothetical protein